MALAGAGTARPRARDSTVTFTVGINQDVDSLNPFTGIAAASYEIYQLITTRSPTTRRRTSRRCRRWPQSWDDVRPTG